MIKINEIKGTTCELYDPADNLLGTIDSELVLNDIRIQIQKEGTKGYYIVWDDEKLRIDKYGNLDNWPEGFFDTVEKQYMTLLGWDKK